MAELTSDEQNNKSTVCHIAYEEVPLVLIPNPEGTRLVEDALYHLEKRQSYRGLSVWLLEKTGKEISYQTKTHI